MNWKQKELLQEIAGSIIGAIILGVFLLGGYFAFTNMVEDNKIAKETKDNFCPDGRTYEGLFEVKSYCEGKEYTCSTTECYWIRDKEEKRK